MAPRTYKIRSSTAGPDARKVYRLTVPAEIAELVPDDQVFEVELAEEGIVYRPVKDVTVAEVPSWAKKKR
jgi:hypothetical protein